MLTYGAVWGYSAGVVSPEQISPAPEPASWALLLAGIGCCLLLRPARAPAPRSGA